MMRIREVEDLLKLDLIDESRFMCFNTIVHYLIFHKFSQNFLKTNQRESDVGHEEVSKTD